MKMLSFYKGTLIVASHDVELFRNSISTLWHIDNRTINIFNGKYDDHLQTISQKRRSIEDKLYSLVKEKKENHKALMKQQQRSKKRNKEVKGEKLVEQKRWIPAVGDLKESSAKKCR
ncbi:hypothetical protein AGMMS49921_00670 [Endomicrobiia bacterium]|nr:hypothetical protein AGMMS49921_00670 [Endomicrobiia bacterium]